MSQSEDLRQRAENYLAYTYRQARRLEPIESIIRDLLAALTAVEQERDELRRAIWPTAPADTDARAYALMAEGHREDSERVDQFEAAKEAAEFQLAQVEQERDRETELLRELRAQDRYQAQTRPEGSDGDH